MDNISANITEIPEDISANISEIPENISANISAPTVKTGGATYTIDFDENSTIWAFYSKNIGNISSIELTNIDSYTIDNVSISLPFPVDLNTVYLIEIVKSAVGAAQMIINIDQSTITELIDTVDFSIGNGRWAYLLGDLTANTTLLKYDNDLFTRANYAGGGAWSVNPLASTITLPTLPANGVWSKVLYIKDDYMLVSGGNTASADKYFCKVSLLDVVTDLDGNVDQYSTFNGGQANQYMHTQIYDYVNNIVYFGLRIAATTAAGNYVVYLDLKDNSFGEIDFVQSNTWSARRKIFFEPYMEIFKPYFDTINADNNPTYSYGYDYSVGIAMFNQFINKVYRYTTNDSRRLGQLNHKGIFEGFEGCANSIRGPFFYSYDKENNHFIVHTRVNNNYRHQYRKYGVQSQAYDPIFEEASEVNIWDAMYCKNYLHLSIYDSYNWLHIFDMNIDVTIESAEFGYLVLPVKCWSLYANRIL